MMKSLSTILPVLPVNQPAFVRPLVARKKRDYERIVLIVVPVPERALLNATLFLFTRCSETYRHPLSTPRTTSQTSVCHQNLHVLFNLFRVSRSVSSIHCGGCAIHPSSYKHECITANGRICVHYYYRCGCLCLSLFLPINSRCARA